jgi:hypothetical protein
VLVDDKTDWVQHYRGLWGLDTRDRFGGERAPAGPRYERGGAVRQSWSDPIGWAGLQKVAPSRDEFDELLSARMGEIDRELAALDADIDARRVDLRRLEVAATSIRGREGFEAIAARHAAEVAERERDLLALVAARTALVDERNAHADTLTRPPAPEPPQAHLRHKHLPFGRSEVERDRFLRIWSTISTPLLFLAAALIIVNHSLGVIAGVAVCAVVFLTFEAIARGRLISFAISLIGVIVVGLLVIATVKGILGEWRIVVGVLLAALALGVLVANLRDLRRG